MGSGGAAGGDAMAVDGAPSLAGAPSLCAEIASATGGAHAHGGTAPDADLFTRLKLLQRHIEFLDIQEEYIKDEQKNLKRELLRAQEEVKRIQSVPLVIGQFLEMVDATTGIVGSTTGSNYYVRILSTLNRELLKPSASVALHRHSNALVDVLPPEADSSISLMSASEKPDVTYAVRWACWAGAGARARGGLQRARARRTRALKQTLSALHATPCRVGFPASRRAAPASSRPLTPRPSACPTATGHRRRRHPEAGDP
jgi:hypothetical protein